MSVKSALSKLDEICGAVGSSRDPVTLFSMREILVELGKDEIVKTGKMCNFCHGDIYSDGKCLCQEKQSEPCKHGYVDDGIVCCSVCHVKPSAKVKQTQEMVCHHCETVIKIPKDKIAIDRKIAEEWLKRSDGYNKEDVFLSDVPMVDELNKALGK